MNLKKHLAEKIILALIVNNVNVIMQKIIMIIIKNIHYNKKNNLELKIKIDIYVKNVILNVVKIIVSKPI